MKILYINDEMAVGGVTICILNLVKKLEKEYEIVVASNGGELIDEFNDIGIRTYTINRLDNKNPLNIIKNIRLVLNIVKKEKIDIIHSHHRMATLLCKIVSKFVGVKVIHTQHVCIEDKFKLTNIVLKNIPTITVSNGAKNILIEKCGLKERNIETIYNGIENMYDPIGIDLKVEQLKKDGNLLVAQVSRVIDYKGVYDFVDIAKDVVNKDNKIKFLLIGDGEEFNNIREYINSKDLRKSVLLLGNKDNILEYLEYIDVMILCSYIEGLPLAPLEAFSKGVPVIGTNIPGTNEEIVHGENGYLVECKDIDSFKNYILKLAEDKTLRNYMSNNAYNCYESTFNMTKYIKNHKEYYKNIMRSN